MFFNLLLPLSFLFLSTMSTASADTSYAGNTSIKQWSLTLTAEQYMEYKKKDSENTTQLYSDYIYTFNTAHTFRYLQGAAKRYVIDMGQDEFAVDNGVLYHYYSIDSKWGGIDWKWRSSLTMPFSSVSREKDLVTVLGGKLYITKKNFAEDLIISYRPNAIYYVNKYKQDGGGELLNQWLIEHSLALSYKLAEPFSINALISSHILVSEKGKYQPRQKRENGKYTFDIYAEYQALDQLSLRLGHSQSDSQVSDGIRTTNLFDNSTSSFFLAADYAF